VKTAKIVIDKNIGLTPTAEELKAGEAMTFSLLDMQNFIESNQDADIFEVLLNTNGGSVTQGVAIYNLLLAEKTKGKQVKTVAFKANSIGSVIFAAGDVREVFAKSEIMIHFPFLQGDALKNENLTSEKLQEITAEIIDAETQIFDIYKAACKLTDSEFIEVQELMKNETNIEGAGALKYGFATHLIKNIIAHKNESKVYAYTDKIAAILKEKTNNNNMDKEIKSQLDKLANGIKNLFKAQNLNEDGTPLTVTNSSATASDGTILYFTESTLVDGIAVFSDEAMTIPATDGIYQIDGSEVYVTAGLVEKIETIEDVATVALKLENSTLKAELEALKTTNATIEAANLETVNQLKEISTEFQNLKKIIPSDIKNIAKDSDKPKTKAQIDLENRRKFR
jgi:ATP-dependent protease ClpP protease subunit